MNTEMAKIRETMGLDEKINDDPKRLSGDELILRTRELNMNLTRLYFKDMKNEATLDDYVNAFIKNIYIVLEIFNEMNIYPDYFFDQTFLYNIEFQKFAKNNPELEKSQLKKLFYPGNNYYTKLREGVEKKYNKIQSMPSRDINDYFVELISFYQVFEFPYNKPENVKEIFDYFKIDISNIMTDYINSDFLYEDIECLTKLLFSYLSFFVEIGVNPKEYFDKYVEEKKSTKKK